jgi:outer membrane protein OmpA-like peptidoglycan-associated protein
MPSRANGRLSGKALTLAVTLAVCMPRAGAQVIGNNVCLAGFFSETNLSFPASTPASGKYRLGGGIRAGFELMGLPDSSWLFAMAGDYDSLPSTSTSNQNTLLLGGELRASYAFVMAGTMDLAPFLGLAIDKDVVSGDIAVVPSVGCSFDLHLGSWSYVSLIPQFAYPIGVAANPCFGLGLGFKQLLAWDNGRPRLTPQKIAAPSSAPQATLTPSPALFSPDGEEGGERLDIGIRIENDPLPSSWELVVNDPYQHRFASWNGKGAPPADIVWDGKSTSGELVNSASDYSLVLSLVDASGATIVAKASVITDVLVIRDGDRYRIRIPSIIFPANSAQLSQESGEEFMKQNIQVLSRLVQILQRFHGYRITIEGNANLVNWDDPTMATAEDRAVLMPLSLQRAQAVKDALVRLGISAERIRVVGRGGQNPLVPFGDKENNWKNRRVEVLLDR